MAFGTLAKVGASVLAFGAGAGLTLVVVDTSDATPPVAARAWIDRPLDGSALPDDDVQLIAHATDPDGVAELVLTIDGDEVATEPGGGDELVTVDLTWSPPGPGTYELVAVATDGDGDAGDAASATFTVGEPDESDTTTTTAPGDTSTTDTTEPGVTTTTEGETTTTAPGATTTRPGATTTTTRPPTTTTTPPCHPAVPSPRTPTPGQRFTSVRTPIKFSWNYAGCGPDHFTVQVSTSSTLTPGPDDYFKQVTVPGGDLDVNWELFPCANLQYYWRMRAVDAGGSSAWTPIRSFSIVCG